MLLADVRAVAFNPSTASDNRIHADDEAQRFGFRGGLVPGVVVYAYLVEPALRAWGRDWLERGAATIDLRRPLYDGAPYRVSVAATSASAYQGGVESEPGLVCAAGEVSLGAPDDAAERPRRRGDPPAPSRDDRPEASRLTLERLAEAGLGSIDLAWRGAGEMAWTSRDPALMPDLVRPDREGLAGPAFLLGLANWALAANVRLGPWIHVTSRARHLRAVGLGTTLRVEARVTGLESRRTGEVVELEVAAFDGEAPVLDAVHRAIYLLHPRT